MDTYDRMTQYLRKLYDVPLFERAGRKHPVAAFYPAPDQAADVDSCLGNLPRRAIEASDCAFYDHAYLATMQNSGRKLFNGHTFAYQRLETQPLRIEAGIGRYYDMLATCASLEAEIRAAAEQDLMRLPARQQLHRHIPAHRAVWDGRGRSAAIGGAVCVVYNDAGTYQALLARRSMRAVTDPGWYHVLPAFIFQPLEATPQAHEWRFSWHVEREYCEELFGAQEGEAGGDHTQHPAYHDLRAMMQRGQAELRLTGITVNLLTLRAEINALLLIHDADWWRRIHAPDSPIAFNAHAEVIGGEVARLPIHDDAAILAALPPDLHRIMPPQGYAALWMGVDAARARLQT